MTEQQNRELLATVADTYNGIREGSSYHEEIISYYNSISPLPVGYKMKMSDPWCAAFVSAIFWTTFGSTLDFPYECSCDRMRLAATKLGIWVEDDVYMPKVGDVILYDWQDNGIGDNQDYPDHVGIVDEVWTDTFKVIEGNLNDSVSTRILHQNNKFIRGFITPDYASISATPITEELSDAQKWFRDTFHISIRDDGWDDGVALTYRQLADILYLMK